jgi:DNA-binding NtrC family response regulator
VLVECETYGKRPGKRGRSLSVEDRKRIATIGVDPWPIRRTPVGKPILLIEPYEGLVEILGYFLEELGYQYDVVTGTEVDEKDLTKKSYVCVLINIDQNSRPWRECGVNLAETASKLNVPVVMIADHEVDAATVAAKGWAPVQKPFTVEKLASAISQALCSA